MTKSKPGTSIHTTSDVKNDYDPLETFVEGDVKKLMQKSDPRDDDDDGNDLELIVYDDGKIRPRDYAPNRRRSEESIIGHKKVSLDYFLVY